MKKLSIVVPIFKSSNMVDELHQRIVDVVTKITDDWELILVDDASSDGTFDKMKLIKNKDPHVKIIGFSKNMGQHHALLCGIQHSNGDYVFTLDDDLQNPPEEIPRFIEKIDQGFDLVMGKVLGKKKHSFLRNLSSYLVQKMMDFIIKKPKDVNFTTFRAMTGKIAKEISKFQGVHIYLPALLLRATPHDKICNILVTHHERKFGESTYTIRKLLKLFSYMVFNHSKLPIRLIMIWGGIVTLVSGIWIINDFVLGFNSSHAELIILGMSFFFGNLLISIGILGEYIFRLIEENNNATQFPIYEKYL